MYDVIINMACELCGFVCCATYQAWYRAMRDLSLLQFDYS